MRLIKKAALIASFAIAVVLLPSFVNRALILNKKSGEPSSKGFAVIELFTSEGCSSCPPADDLVARIQKENNDKPVYILSFHVDYWNRLGWKDVFSSAESSKRQNQYARWLNLQSVYTPEIVVNGKKEFVGSEEGTLRTAVSAGLASDLNLALMINAQKLGDEILVQYKTTGSIKNTNILLALVQKSAQTIVKNGENRGRILNHVQIVRKAASLPLNQSGAGSIKISIPDGFNTRNWELIGFIQNKNNGTILGAARSSFSTASYARR